MVSSFSMTSNVDHAAISPAAVEAIAGLSAGSIATLIVHPLDIVKTRMQIHRSVTAPSASLTTISFLKQLIAAPHPVAALYRGLTPNLLGNATSWAAFFFFKSRCERAIAQLRYGSSAAAGVSSPSPSSPALTPGDYFLASGLAGAGVQVLTNPIWVLKTRMLSSDRAASGAYPSMAAGAARLLRAEGWRGFYRGLGVSLLGVSHGAVQFGVYEPAKRAYLGGRKAGDEGVSNEATVVLASGAKIVAGAVTYPYQVVRSRLQNYDAEARFGKGIVGVVRRLWGEEGVRGFYRGLGPGVVRVLPATWVTFLVYENVKFYLPRWIV